MTDERDEQILNRLECFLRDREAAQVPAILMLGGQHVSTGQVLIEGHQCRFQPTDGNTFDHFPQHGGKLKRLDTGAVLDLLDFVKCNSEPLHCHCRFGRK